MKKKFQTKRITCKISFIFYLYIVFLVFLHIIMNMSKSQESFLLLIDIWNSVCNWLFFLILKYLVYKSTLGCLVKNMP